jgi:hypothetical protein
LGPQALVSCRPISRADGTHQGYPPGLINIEVGPLIYEEGPVSIADQEAVVDALSINDVSGLDMVDTLNDVLRLKPLVEHLMYHTLGRVRLPETTRCHSAEIDIGCEEGNKAISVLSCESRHKSTTKISHASPLDQGETTALQKRLPSQDG